MKRARDLGVAVLLALAMLFATRTARADFAEDFQRANAALVAGKTGEAIAAYESLADRGFVDPNASYNRGLAYIERVRIGGEEPGDLGRAAHGFEEARELGSSDLADDSEVALTAVRGEIARRRARSGLRSPVSERPALGDAIVHLLPVRVCALFALISSLLFSAALVGRLSSRVKEAARHRLRAASTAVLLVAGPLLLVSALFSILTLRDRREREEFVIVAANSYPGDARGVAIPGLDPLPEGGRVRRFAVQASLVEVEWQGKRVWVPRNALRPLSLRKS